MGAQKKKNVKTGVAKTRYKSHCRSANIAPIKKCVKYSSIGLGRPVNLQKRKISISATRGRYGKILIIAPLNLTLLAQSFFSLFFDFSSVFMNIFKHTKKLRCRFLISDFNRKKTIFDLYEVTCDFDGQARLIHCFLLALHGFWIAIYHFSNT